jgi:peptidoglycan/LPS O-acetylase OafA/YrhL
LTNSSQTNRLPWLDAARGIAALTVLTAHALDYYWRGYAEYIQFGNGAVVLFFLISGYIIPMSIERSTLPRFWLRRLFRLYPLYWISIILYTVLGISETKETTHILANLTMIQPYLGIPHINGVYWSLAVEETFYLMLAVLLVFNLHRATVPLFLVLAAAGMTLAYLGARWVLDLNLIYLPICVAGTLWYRFDQGVLKRRSFHVLVLVLILYIISLPIGINWLSGWLVAVGIFAFIHRHRHRSWPSVLVWCGIASYSIYLLHPLILHFLPGWGAVITLVVAGASYTLVEKPCINLGRRLEQYIGRRHIKSTTANAS